VGQCAARWTPGVPAEVGSGAFLRANVRRVLLLNPAGGKPPSLAAGRGQIPIPHRPGPPSPSQQRRQARQKEHASKDELLCPRATILQIPACSPRESAKSIARLLLNTYSEAARPRFNSPLKSEATSAGTPDPSQTGVKDLDMVLAYREREGERIQAWNLKGLQFAANAISLSK